VTRPLWLFSESWGNLMLSRLPAFSRLRIVEKSSLTGLLVSLPLILVLVKMLELLDEPKSLQGLVFSLLSCGLTSSLPFDSRFLVDLGKIHQSCVLLTCVRTASFHHSLFCRHTCMHSIYKSLWTNNDAFLSQNFLLLLQKPVDFSLPLSAWLLIV
jgi:hypothetical protein